MPEEPNKEGQKSTGDRVVSNFEIKQGTVPFIFDHANKRIIKTPTVQTYTIGFTAGPAGSDTQIQFNDGGVMGADADFTWNKSTDTLTLGSFATIATPSGEDLNILLGAGGGLFLDTADGTTPGDVAITAGDSNSGTNDGGDIRLEAGNPNGAAIAGNITLTGGQSSTSGASGGNLIFTPGSTSGTNNSAGKVQALLASGNGTGKDSVFEITTTSNGQPSRRTTGRILTTDGSATSASSRRMPTMDNDSTLFIKAMVTARRTGGTSGSAGDSAGYEITAVYNKDGAAAPTIVGAIQADFTVEDQAGWNATFVVSSNDVLLQVTGAADNNVTWSFEVYHQLNT